MFRDNDKNVILQILKFNEILKIICILKHLKYENSYG